MVEEALTSIGLLVVLLPFYMQLSVYSLAYRVLKFEPSEQDATAFVDRQLPPLRWLCRKSLKRLYQARDSENCPTTGGMMFQRILIAIIPAAFIVAVMFGMLSTIENGENQRIILYLLYGVVFVVALYRAWNFGTQLEAN